MLRCLIFGHRYGYRERRKLHGVQVMCFVCCTCQWAVPCVARTAQEHRRVTKLGRVQLGEAKREGASVVPLRKAGR